jgi:hypothetical protein
MDATEAEAMTQRAVDALNEAFKRDPAAMHALVATGIPCNQALADDPFIIVDQMPVLKGGPYHSVRLGGVLAGIMDAIGLPKIATHWSDLTDDDGRKKMIGFCVYQVPPK